MKLSFKIFGFEIATLELELELPAGVPTEAVLDVLDPVTLTARATKWVSRKWVRGMLA